MIVLRIAIGWHLAYEGYTKIMSTQTGAKPFSAEMYLRQSTGPLRFYFRGLVDDFHGLGMLDEEQVSLQWDNYVAGQGKALGLTDEAMGRVQEILTAEKADLRSYLEEKKDEIARYRESIDAFEAREQRPLPGLGEMPEGKLLREPLPKFEWDVHKKAQKDLDKTRAELTGPVMTWSQSLTDALKAEATAARSTAVRDAGGELGVQPASAVGATVPGIQWKPNLQMINLTTMWGLALCGSLLILGLFTRTAALGAAALLTLFYLSMPPWPGLDPAPIAEGTYLIVNKNLIELIALLMIASSPVGVWGGIDSLIRGIFTRPVLGVGKREVLEEI